MNGFEYIMFGIGCMSSLFTVLIILYCIAHEWRERIRERRIEKTNKRIMGGHLPRWREGYHADEEAAIRRAAAR